jgi:polygalacturonase
MIYSIADYHAANDGVHDCTEAFQKAIDQCSGNGGGRVYVPAGRYLCGTIRLRSETELYLEQGAVLISSLEDEHKEYFLYACHEKNVTLDGPGMIDGQGRLRYYDDNADGGFHECPLQVRGNRPRTSYLEDIDGLTVKDVTFYDAVRWTLHMAGCKNVLIDGIRIRNNDRCPNNDGIDPDCCRNVIIRNCLIETGDDSIVVKTTKDMASLYGPCENILISGCTIHTRDSALKIGTESWSDIRNVVMSDCIAYDCSRGIGIWSRDGGTVSDIHVHHLTGNTLQYADCPERPFAPRWWGKGEPVFLSATKRENGDRIPGPIENIHLDHFSFTAESCIFLGGEACSGIRDVFMDDMDIRWKKQGLHLPELFDEQPSGRGVYRHEVPCVYGRYAQHVNIGGRLSVDPSMQNLISRREMLDCCDDFVIREEKS